MPKFSSTGHVDRQQDHATATSVAIAGMSPKNKPTVLISDTKVQKFQS